MAFPQNWQLANQARLEFWENVRKAPSKSHTRPKGQTRPPSKNAKRLDFGELNVVPRADNPKAKKSSAFKKLPAYSANKDPSVAKTCCYCQKAFSSKGPLLADPQSDKNYHKRCSPGFDAGPADEAS